MISLDKDKLATVRTFWKEISITALSITVAYLFNIIIQQNNRIDDLRKEEIQQLKDQAQEKAELAKYWRDAFITTAQYNKYLQKNEHPQ